MKATCIPAVSMSIILAFSGLFLAGSASPSARAETQPVQPGDRLAGQWVADRASVATYLTSVLLPASAQCEWFHGNLLYKFIPGGMAPNGATLNTLEIVLDGAIIHLTRGRSGPGPADRIEFGLNMAYASPYAINAADQLLEFGSPAPDASSASVENLIVNDVEVMRESGSVDMLGGMDMSFLASKMRFEFLGDGGLQLTPIFPPAPDGVTIEPQPIILHRR